MTLPDYDDSGRLPCASKPYATTLDEIRVRFVENATTAKAHRERLFRALEMHVELVRRKFGTGIRAWIDGGFVIDKDWPPKDIDVAYVMPVERYVEASRPEHASLWTLQAVSAQSPSLFTDRLQPMGGLIDAFPAIDDPSQTGYWHDKWSGVTDRNGERIEGERKGFVEVTL